MENYRFNVKGTFVDYPKLKCKEPLQAIKIKMDKSCDSYNNGDFYQIGFNVKEFLEIYRICFHKVRKVPLYAEYTLIPSAAGVKSPPIETWLDSEIVKYNQTEMYDCKKQKDDLSSILDKQFQHEESWCFTAKQLVNEKDVIPGFAQMLTHSYLNFIPYWSSGDVKNWDKCEEILRSTTKMKDKYLLIRTGISQKLELPSKTSGLRTVHIADKAGNKNLVPMFLWKVITDVVEGASVAIIHLNIPDLSWIDVNSYIICPNICDRIDWLKDINTDDINNGFIYCCSIFEFEKAFKYRYVFSKGYGRLLKTL
ncbi:uncharacterized protein [Battus philenor]|uniref:uncharacterized protein n=1 Tax=Battus philenor TaxID=42288 RepID=UPI0035CEBDD8